MRELIACWQNTRAMVLIALCAALFVTVLIPFKLLTIVPGITEIRPAAVLPIAFSILFGPIAAWGAAFGNVIGDFFGTIGPGSFFGVLGNFVYGYAPYRIVLAWRRQGQELHSARGRLVFAFAIVSASALCAVIIALGIDFLKIVPFAFLVHTIFLNNLLLSLALAPLLVRGLERRIFRMKLGYREWLHPEQISRPILGRAGAPVLLALTMIVYCAMMFPGLMTAFPALAGNPKPFALAACLLLFLASLLLL